jgi:hypothetical protein
VPIYTITLYGQPPTKMFEADNMSAAILYADEHWGAKPGRDYVVSLGSIPEVRPPQAGGPG